MSHRRRSAALLACVVSITGCTPAVYKLEERFAGAVNGTPFASAPSSTTAPLTDLDPASYPLIEAVPALRGALQVVPLCDCPTPIQRLEHVALETGTTDAPVEVYAKQDGASNHAIYGGNDGLQHFGAESALPARSCRRPIGSRKSRQHARPLSGLKSARDRFDHRLLLLRDVCGRALGPAAHRVT